MNKIKIKEVFEGSILFNNGSVLGYDYLQDCCENNYADFKQVDDIALEQTFTLPLDFEETGCGFMFGNKPHKMFFIPCYSEQNGYYSPSVDIYFDDKKVLEGVYGAIIEK